MCKLKILLLGKKGQLGWEAQRELFCLGDVFAYDYPEIDFLQPDPIINLIQEIQPDLIFNAIAYTAVDKAESEPENANKINADTPGLVAEVCKQKNIPLIHISTDYVFDGLLGRDYFEADTPSPINVYGSSKLLGEQYIQQSGCEFLIFRTSWVYSMREGGFLQKVIQWSKNYEVLRIVDDQIGNPTWARMLANLTTRIIPSSKNLLNEFFQEHKGLYHLAGSGAVSRFAWTKFIIENLPKDAHIKTKTVIPAKTSDFPTPAARPLHSALDCSKFENEFDLKIPDWKLSLSLSLIN
jgi:dTDP-4-dehydrorhamnose reductase